ncbi:MAG TPA: YncE family protein [Nitrosopumilaceae archaeon]|nr:YncE family protein [Nitrosopumilaceae archaeon]
MVWGKRNVKVLTVCIITILFFSSFQIGLDDFLNHTISKDLAEQNNAHRAYALSSIPGTNLVNQIELLDYYFPILSTSFVEVPGTQFNLNPSLYDGQVTFFFEVVMQSQSSSNTVTAKLFDKTSNTVVSNSILSTSSTSPVRLRSPALALPSSADEYAIQVSASSNSGLLLSGRMIVSQNGATNTSVVIPIGNVALSLSGQPDGNNPMSTSSTSLTLVRQIAKIYHFNQTKFDGKLNVFFESVVSTTKFQRTASAYLFDLTANNTVAGSQVSTSNFIPTKVRSGNLTLASGHDYTFAISSSSTDATALSFASRIIITQNNFTSTEIPIRVGNIYASVNTNLVNATTSISSINASAFTSPRFSFEADLFTTNSSLPVSVNLFDLTKNSVTSGSTVTASSTVSTRVRAENVTLSQTADEYITQLKGSGNLVTVNNGWVLVSMNSNLIKKFTDIMTELGTISSIADESVVTDYLNKTIISLKANTTSLVSDPNARSTLTSILDNALQNVQSAGNSVSALDKANANMSINNARTSITNYINQVSSFSGTSIPTTTANILVSEAQQILTDTHKQGTAIVGLVKNNPLTVTSLIINKAKTDGTNLRQITNSLISLGFKVTLNAVHHSPTVTDILFSNAATLQSFDVIIPANILSMYAVLGISDETASVGNSLSNAEFAATMNVTPLMVNNLLNSPDVSADIKLAVGIACHPIFTTQECQFGFANPTSPLARFQIGGSVASPIIGTVISACFAFDICGPLLEKLQDELAHIFATNLQQTTPTVTVVKVVNGGNRSASDFMIHVRATPQATPPDFRANLAGTVVRVLPGGYDVTEDAVSGYIQSFGPDCKMGSITSLGQHKICTITNTFVLLNDGFDNGLNGWTFFGDIGYYKLNLDTATGRPPPSANIDGEVARGGCSKEGMQKVVDISSYRGGPLTLAFNYRVMSTFSSPYFKVTHAIVSVVDPNTGADLFTYFLNHGTVTDSDWQYFSTDISSFVSGKSAIKLQLYHGDCWYSTYAANNWYDNVQLVAGTPPPPPPPPPLPTQPTTITVGQGPIFAAVNPNTNKVYVTNTGAFFGIGNTVSVIDGATDTVTATIAGFNYPYDIAVNPTTNMIYVTNIIGSTVSVINGATNTVTATIGLSAPAAIAVNPTTNMVYVTNYAANTVSVINGATNTVTATIPVGNYPIGVAVNPTTNMVYVTNYVANTVSVINGATNTVTATIPVGNYPYIVAVNPTTNMVYFTNYIANYVSVINGATGTLTGTIIVGSTPTDVQINPSTNKIFVSNGLANEMSVIDGATNTVTAVLPAGLYAYGIGVNPSTNKEYVANYYSNTVSLITGATSSPLLARSTSMPQNPPSGPPYFSLQVNQTSVNATRSNTTVVPLKVVWNTGYTAQPVSATFMGNTTSVIPSVTSIINTTSSQLFNVNLKVPSSTPSGNYHVGVNIAEPDGASRFIPLFVRVQ